MFATALAMTAAALPPTAPDRAMTTLRVEATVVRPARAPSVARSGRQLLVDNPDAVMISIDDGPASALPRLRITSGLRGIRRITFIY